MKTRIYLFIYMSYANFFLLLKPAIGNKSLEKKTCLHWSPACLFSAEIIWSKQAGGEDTGRV